MEPENSQLNQLLAQRSIMPPSSNLAERIISVAARTPQRSAPNFGAWLQGVFAEFMLPRPAYALVSILMMGFAIGLSAPYFTDVDDDDDSSPQAFLYDESDNL